MNGSESSIDSQEHFSANTGFGGYGRLNDNHSTRHVS